MVLIVGAVGCPCTMADEPLALSTIPDSPAEGDYDAICAAVMHSARGRWFLQEFAKRNRNSDTDRVLDAIGRLEHIVRDNKAEHAHVALRGELLDMARTIAQARAEVADIRADDALGACATEPETAVPPASADRSDMAERMREIAAIMRAHGLDAAARDQIESLASALPAMPSLHDPKNQRAQKLNELLRHLEQRIDRMLEASAAPNQSPTETAAVHGSHDESVAAMHPDAQDTAWAF